MVRRSILALATMYLTAHGLGGDDGYRQACASVALDEGLCEASQKLAPAGGRYGGYIEGEHRFVRDLSWCALTVDDEDRVVRVRYLEPSMSWQSP